MKTYTLMFIDKFGRRTTVHVSTDLNRLIAQRARRNSQCADDGSEYYITGQDEDGREVKITD